MIIIRSYSSEVLPQQQQWYERRINVDKMNTIFYE